MSLTLQVAGVSDLGCVRQNNEDNFGYDGRYGIYVVCDGMGGAAAGEVASKMAVDTVLTYFRDADNLGHYPPVGEPVDRVSERANALGYAIRLANEAVFQSAAEHAARSGMGSTIVAVLAHKGFVSIGHVGDSRIYRIRNGAIEQLTQDHSLVMEQVRHGFITLEQARTSDVQNVILRALGSEESVQVDLDELIAMSGDVLLLCSDGLTRHVEDPQILELISAAPNVRSAANALIEAARAGGGSDNITALLLRFEAQPWYKSIFRRILPGGSPKWQNSI